jgi:hypothetical protein
MKKKLAAILLALVLLFAFTSTAFAESTPLTVNFKSYVNTQIPYYPTSYGKLTFIAYAKVYATSSSLTPLTGSTYNQEFKVTALYSGQPTQSFGTDYKWSGVTVTISGLNTSTAYTCQFGNTQEQYYIKGTVYLIHD